MHSGGGHTKRNSDSYIQVRMVSLVGVAALALALVLPAILRAVDLNNDNLDDAWEIQYGITTNAYATTNLVGWWQMQSNPTNVVVDSSTNHVTGTLTNFPSNPFGAGLFSNALYFPAHGQVNFSTNSVLNTATNRFTFSTWIQTTNSLSEPATIVTWTDLETNSWSVGTDTNGVVGLTFSDAVGDLQTVSPAMGAIQLYDGTWHQVAVTYDTNHEANVYVDGVNQASGTITNWASGPVASFNLGAPDSSSTNQTYALDDTRLYNRALAPNEITQLPVTYTDLNGSGLSVFDDYLEGLNPLSANGIVTSGFIDSGLIGYYNNQLPTLAKTMGDRQSVTASTFASNSLVVHVTDATETALVNAPITFSIGAGSDGGLSLTNGGATATSLSLTTDSSGNATVYYKAGTDGLKTNTIVANAVSGAGIASVSFSEYCGVQDGLVLWLRADEGMTCDGGGNVSEMLDESVNGYVMTQATSGNEPQLVTDSETGKSALSFSGNQWLSGTDLISANQDLTIISVSKDANNQAWEEQFALGTNPGTRGMRSYGYHNGQAELDIYQAEVTAGTAAQTNHNAIATTTYTRSSGATAFYLNGITNGTASISVNDLSAGFILGGPGWPGAYWNGTISEVLVYNRVLTSSDQQDIEVYLADKYGVYHPDATWPLAYNSDVQAQITANQWNKEQADIYAAFLATDPPVPPAGLELWLKADAGVTADGSGNVSQWVDQGPRHETVTQATTATEPQLVLNSSTGKAALRFNGSQWLHNSSTLPLGSNQDMTIIILGATSSPSAHENSFSLGNGTHQQCRQIGYLSSSQYFDFYFSYALGISSPPPNTMVSEEVTFDSIANNVTFYRNGSQTATGSDSATGLTAGITIGADPTQTCDWLGDISEILVYNRKLTTAEIAEVDGYLADKYGLYDINATWTLAYSTEVQNQITANQWNKIQADAYVASESNYPSITSEGLVVHLDAGAGVIADSGGKVTQWNDQTAYANHATQSSGGNQPFLVPNAIDSKPALDFDGASSYLTIIDSPSLRPGQMTVIAVATLAGGSNYQPIISKPYYNSGSWNSPWVSYALGIDPTDSPYFQCAVSGTAEASGSGQPLHLGQAYVLSGTYDGSTDSLRVAGSAPFNLSVSGSVDNGDSARKDLVIGAASSTWLGQFFTGQIAEVLIYNRALTDTERQQAEAYLAYKYEIYDSNATWISAYSAEVQEVIATNQWNKAQADAYVAFLATDPPVPADGLALWVKADAGITADGEGYVSQWEDQGPSHHLASQTTSSNQPQLITDSQTGKPALSFSGNQWVYGPDLVPAGQDITIITVDQTNDTSTFAIAASLGTYSNSANNGSVRGVGYRANQPEFDLAYGSSQSGTAPPTGKSNINTTTFSRSSGAVSFYANGTFDANGTISGVSATDESAGFIVGGGSWLSSFWSGTISEALFYNRILTDSERQQIEGYLADKYGIYNPSATWPSGYSSDVQALISSNQWDKVQADAYVAFYASDQPVPNSGLSLWLKADAGVTADGSGHVSAWADQGPYGNNAGPSSGNPVTLIASGTGGKPMLHFNGSNWLAIPDSASLRPNYITVMAVAQENSAATYQTFISRSWNSSSGWGYPYISWDTCLFGVNGGNYLRSAMTTGGNLTENNAGNYYDLSQPHVFGWTYDGTAQNVYLSGTQTASTATSGVIDYDGGTASICIGARSASSPAETLNADVSEILIYDHALSDSDRAQVEGYLADKYGLIDPDATWPLAYSSEVQAEITRNQWNKAQADNYVALENSNSTTLTHGLKFWLKADAGVTHDGGGNVSAWADQTGNYTVTQSGSAMPSYLASDVNGQPALHFNGNQWLYNPSNMGAGVDADITMIVVGTSNNPGALQEDLFLGNGSGHQNRGMGYYQTAQLIDISNGYALGAGAPAANTYVSEVLSLNSSLSTATFYRNGIQTSSPGVGGLANVTPGITVGATTDQYAPWQGNIAEVLVYDHQLSSDELAQVDGYLADKYGYYSPNATWPESYSSAVQAQISLNQWNKAQADGYVAFQSNNPGMLTTGLKLWLKADNGVNQDGSGNVNSWTDQTGNYTVSQSGGVRPTYVASDINGKPALHFNGGQALYNPNTMAPGVNGDMTMIAVGSTYNPGALQYTIYLGNTGGYANRGLGYYASRQLFDLSNGNYSLGTSTPNPNTVVAEAWTLASNLSNVTFYRNGVQTGTATMGSVQGVTPGITIGGYNGYGTPWQGDIAEVLVYDHQLSPDQLAQVDGYLADKYGYYSPNATWPSAYSSDVQAQITANQWNKDQADAYLTFLASLAAFAADNPDMVTSGLVVWLEADGPSSVASDISGNVSEWADQTPYQNNANQGNSGNRPTLITSTTGLNGKPVVRFNGGNTFLDISDNPSLQPAGAVTVIAVAQTYGSGQQDIVNRTLSYGAYGDYWNGPQYSYDLGTDNNNVERGYIGTSGGSDLGGTKARGHHMTIGTMIYDGTNQTIYDSGLQQATAVVSGAIDYNSPNEHDLYLGVHNGYFGLGGYLNGDIAEVLVYNRALTTSEQQEVEAYLGDKYGVYDANATWPLTYSSDVQALITANEWSKAQTDAYVAFVAAGQPVATSGLAVWLKADTGVTANGSGNVSAWSDQTVYQNNANQGDSGHQPTLVTSTTGLNGKPVVRFDGSSSYLTIADNPSLWPSGAVTIIALAQTYSNNQQDLVDRSLNYGSFGDYWNPPQYSYELGTDSNNIERGYLGTPGGSDLPGPAGRSLRMSVATMVYDGTHQTIYDSGIEQSSAAVSGAIDYNNPNEHDLYIGTHSGYFGLGGFFDGDVAEILIYNRALTTSEQQQAEGYLADKYGVYDANATWPSVYGSDVQALITANEWSKAQVDAYVAFAAADQPVAPSGLIVWLEANSGVTADGSGKVTAWADQTVFKNNANQGNSGNQPTLITSTGGLNGNPVVRFDGSSSYLAIKDNPSLWPTGAVTIIALSQTYSNVQQDLVDRSLNYGAFDDYWYAPQYSYELGTDSDNVERGYVGTSGGSDLGGSAGRAYQMSVSTMIYDGTNQTIYDGGTQQSSVAVTGTIDYNNPNEHDLYIGTHNGYFGLGGYFNGDVAEVLVYNRALTT